MQILLKCFPLPRLSILIARSVTASLRDSKKEREWKMPFFPFVMKTRLGERFMLRGKPFRSFESNANETMLYSLLIFVPWFETLLAFAQLRDFRGNGNNAIGLELGKNGIN